MAHLHCRIRTLIRTTWTPVLCRFFHWFIFGSPDWNVCNRDRSLWVQYPFGKGIRIWIWVSGNMFGIILCNHRVWNLAVEINHNGSLYWRIRIRIPNPKATLYYAEHVHIAQTQTRIPTPYRTGIIGIWVRFHTQVRLLQCKWAIMAYLRRRIRTRTPIRVQISVPKMGPVTIVDPDLDQNPSPCLAVSGQYNVHVRQCK